MQRTASDGIMAGQFFRSLSPDDLPLDEITSMSWGCVGRIDHAYPVHTRKTSSAPQGCGQSWGG
jgi:hypothetical protein